MLRPKANAFSAAAAFVGAGICLGLALHCILLPSRGGTILGLYHAGKFAAILGLGLLGSIAAVLWRRFETRANAAPPLLSVLVAASLSLLILRLCQGIRISSGGDLMANLLAADQSIHGLKEHLHSVIVCEWGPSGPSARETAITWYPPGPTWIIALFCRMGPVSAVSAAKIIWFLCFIVSSWLLGKALSLVAPNTPWTKSAGGSALLAASVLWWIGGCDPANLGSADMVALPLNFAVLVGCLCLIDGNAPTWRWIGCGLMGGMVYLLKYSQFIDVALLLAVTYCLSRSSKKSKPAVVPLASLLILVSFPIVLTLAQRVEHSAIAYSEKAHGLAQSEYIMGRYGDHFAQVSTPIFALIGCAGGMGWNALGFGRLIHLPWFLNGLSSINRLWDLLGWNRVCGWCLVLGIALTPVAWWSVGSIGAPARRLLRWSASLGVIVLGLLGLQKGYQWNVGLEGQGRLLLPFSAMAIALLLIRCCSRWRFALLPIAVIYVFCPWVDTVVAAFGDHPAPPQNWVAARLQPAENDPSLPQDFPVWTSSARRLGAQMLIVPTEDMDSVQQSLAKANRLPIFGAVLPVCFLPPQRMDALRRIRSGAGLAILMTPSIDNPDWRRLISERGIIPVVP